MNPRINSIIYFCFLLSFFFTASANAEETNTEVAIKLVESPLQLINVTVPSFGTYETSENFQLIRATGGLSIKVKDLRKNKSTPWKLTYQISTFTNKQEYPLKIHLGKGYLTTDTAVESSSYTPQSVSVGAKDIKTFLIAYSDQSEYYHYQIDKDNIHIEIPKNLPTGKFTAKQIITLFNTPEVN